MATAANEGDAARDRIERLETELAAVGAERGASKRTAQRLRNQVENLTTEVMKMRRERDVARAAHEHTKAELAEAQTNTRIAYKTLTEVNKNHEAELERLRIEQADTLVTMNAHREQIERERVAAQAEAAALRALVEQALSHVRGTADAPDLIAAIRLALAGTAGRALAARLPLLEAVAIIAREMERRATGKALQPTPEQWQRMIVALAALDEAPPQTSRAARKP